MAGFSMIEVLVALVIGMLASIVVLQMLANSETRNRTAAGSADAQSNGLMTLYQMQTNIQRAGYGINTAALFNCNTSWIVASTAAIDKSIALAPVSVNPLGTKAGVGSALIPVGDANTDVLMVVMGNGNSEPQGNEILGTAGAVYTVRSQSMFAVGDRVIAAPTACGATTLNIDRVTVSDATTSKVTTASGGAGATLFNLGPGPNSINAIPTAAMPTNGPTVLVYAVRNGSLTVCDFNVNDCSLAANASSKSVWVPLADNVVSMRAVYWQDNSGAAWDGSVSTLSHPDPADATAPAQPASGCAWARVKALNLALVTRSDERDREIVTVASKAAGNIVGATPALAANANSAAAAPTWSTAALNAAAPILLGTDNASDQEWRHYRYKAFEALIPLRNVTWMSAPSTPPTGCT